MTDRIARTLYRLLGQMPGLLSMPGTERYAAAMAIWPKRVGDMPRAVVLYQQALTMNRELVKPDGEAIALEGLGECHLTAGETETGTAYLRQAVEIFQRLGMALDAARVRTRLAGLTMA